MLSSCSVRNGKMSLVPRKRFNTSSIACSRLSYIRKGSVAILSAKKTPKHTTFRLCPVNSISGFLGHRLSDTAGWWHTTQFNPNYCEAAQPFGTSSSPWRGLESPLPSLSFLGHKEGFNLSHVAAFLNLFQSLWQDLYKLICWVAFLMLKHKDFDGTKQG